MTTCPGLVVRALPPRRYDIASHVVFATAVFANVTGSFSGKVSHHEGDVPRLRRLYKAVRETREQLAGCMDPNVSHS